MKPQLIGPLPGHLAYLRDIIIEPSIIICNNFTTFAVVKIYDPDAALKAKYRRHVKAISFYT